MRIIIDEFAPNRNQRRTWKRHHQLTATRHELHYNPHHYELYRRYQEHRHCGGDMDGDSDEQYRHFLLQSNVNSKLVEFHENDQLRMVSIIDELPDGISLSTPSSIRMWRVQVLVPITSCGKSSNAVNLGYLIFILVTGSSKAGKWITRPIFNPFKP